MILSNDFVNMDGGLSEESVAWPFDQGGLEVDFVELGVGEEGVELFLWVRVHEI